MKPPPNKRPAIWPGLATVVALLAAVWPGIRNLRSHTGAEYDPTVALECLTAIVVAWYTYFTYQTLEHARQTAKADADRLRAERGQHREAIDAQISAIAFKLRRELREMLDHPDLVDSRIGSWATAVSQGFPITEREMLQLMSLAPEASGDRATALQQAYVTYYAGSEKINKLVEYPSPSLTRDGEADLFTWTQWLSDAKANLRECVAAVESLISPSLREAEQGVQSRRSAEDPFADADAVQPEAETEE